MWRYNGFMDNWCGPGAFFPGPFGFIISLLFLGFTIYLVVKFGQFLLRPKSFSPPSAIDILKKRYANGEINKDEYDRIGQELVKN